MVRKDVNMTEDEKKLLQAKHRQEAVEARNRQKERKQRTRRLIQQGAILENVFPEAQIMDLDNLKMELERRLSAEVTENIEVRKYLYSRRAHLLTTR